MPDSLPIDQLLALLTSGDMKSLGLLPWGSNYTFLTEIENPRTRHLPEDDDAREDLLAVYKPRRGEAPLWDFPNGTLCMREYGAFLVAQQLGWRIVPPTVMRDGEHGFGSVQLYINNDEDQHYFTFRNDAGCREQLQRICVFDLITNNADRKSGHCIRDTRGHVWGIDHGICFNADYKLRTVIWDFASEPICDEMLTDVAGLRRALDPAQGFGKAMRKLLDRDEVQAFEKRIDGLLKIKVFPSPNRYERSVPWPPV
jgi:uncharacterized repeat protein (TIGR03843 family)